MNSLSVVYRMPIRKMLYVNLIVAKTPLTLVAVLNTSKNPRKMKTTTSNVVTMPFSKTNKMNANA